MTEQQRYRVLQTMRDGVELREYAHCVVADVVVMGSQESAGNKAFRPLASYIGGKNQTRESLAMTAPVIQEARSEKLAMTAPVIQESAGDGQWTVSFVLPGARALADYPIPDDPRVQLRELPQETAAAVRWSGRWTSGNVAARTDALLRCIADAGWEPAGPPRWARFDPPWKPFFARRNEVVIPVSVVPSDVRD